MAEKKITGKEEIKTGTASDKRTTADLAADYQWSLALLNSSPDLRKIFRKATTNDWDAGRFTAELMTTDWFREHAASWRKNEIQRITDPATWEATRNAKRADVEDVARGYGAVMSSTQLKKVSDSAIAFGWNDAQIRNALGSYVKVIDSGTLKGQYIGNAGKWNTELERLAKANGYTIPKGKAKGWLTEMVKGNTSIDEYGEMMRRQAAHAYPAYADELLAGQDLEDLVSPYRKQIAGLLEVDEERIGLNDKLLKSALGYKDAKGKNVPMPLYEFEDKVRADNRWQYTDNAHEQVMGATLNIGRMFGKTG